MGTPPEGYVLKAVQVVPDRIEIVGAQSKVLGINEVQTETISISSERRNLTKRTGVLLGEPNVWVRSKDRQVTVKVFIGKE